MNLGADRHDDEPGEADSFDGPRLVAPEVAPNLLFVYPDRSARRTMSAEGIIEESEKPPRPAGANSTTGVSPMSTESLAEWIWS